IYGDSPATADTPTTCFANYVISGTCLNYGNGLRLDILCTGTESQRILLGETFTCSSDDLDGLSSKLALVAAKMRSAMLADFSPRIQRFAVVAPPPSAAFARRRSMDNIRDIASLVRHNVINLLREFLASDTILDPDKTTEIVEDSHELDRYLEKEIDEGEIVSNLGTEFVVMLPLDDLNGQIRLSAVLYAFRHDPPLLGVRLFSKVIKKTQYRDLIDSAVVNILCNLDTLKLLGPGRGHSDTAHGYKAIKSRYCKQTSSSPLESILPQRQVGFRLGGMSHRDEALFLGTKSTEYFEFYYSIPIFSSTKTLRYVPNELELSVGLDYGEGTLFRHRVTAMNVLMSMRYSLSMLQYTDFPITLSVGPGLGLAGMTYKFRPNESPYTGDRKFDNQEIRPIAAVSGNVRIQAASWLRVDVLYKYQMQLCGPMSHFKDIALQGGLASPFGKYSGYYTLVGISVVFR
ncbi:MAG: hypothetical protein WAU88_03795, partial [Candidatus Zixiibacteriota bacterium]